MEMFGMYGEVQKLEVRGKEKLKEAIVLLTDLNYAVAIVSHDTLWDDRSDEYYDVYVVEYAPMNKEFSLYSIEWVTEDEWLALRDMREPVVDDGEVPF